MIVKPALADHRIFNLDESFVDVVAPFVPHAQIPRPLLPAIAAGEAEQVCVAVMKSVGG